VQHPNILVCEVVICDNALNKVIGLLLCFAAFFTICNAQFGSAQYFGSVNINADGTFEPATAPILRIGETYTLTGDVGSITVERSNIVLDGDGNMLPGIVSSYDDTLQTNITALNSGGAYLKKVENVTVRNLIIKDSQTGIYLDQATNCIITNNTIVGTQALIPQLQITAGVYVWGGNNNTIVGNSLADNYNGLYICYHSQNTIVGNTITNSTSTGIIFWNASSNILYYNNFIDNAAQASANESSINVWDNGKEGNFWSDYNGSDSNGDGVGDTPYIIDSNQQDRYPAMAPFDIDSVTLGAPSENEPFPTFIAIAILSIVAIIGFSVGLIVYFRKRRAA
jgi:parallel beta-helix repeat protein